VVIYGVSKAYAMTGWRIGLALAPGPVAKAMAALQSHTTTGANHPAQFAAAVALGDDQVERDVARMVAEFRKRRDVVVARFRQELPGVEFVEPLGAFYFFFRVDSFGKISGTEFCTRLVTTTGVALVRARRSRRSLRAVVVRGVVGQHPEGARSDHRIREEARRLELRSSLTEHLHPALRHHTVVLYPHPELPS